MRTMQPQQQGLRAQRSATRVRCPRWLRPIAAAPAHTRCAQPLRPVPVRHRPCALPWGGAMPPPSRTQRIKPAHAPPLLCLRAGGPAQRGAGPVPGGEQEGPAHGCVRACAPPPRWRMRRRLVQAVCTQPMLPIAATAHCPAASHCEVGCCQAGARQRVVAAKHARTRSPRPRLQAAPASLACTWRGSWLPRGMT